MVDQENDLAGFDANEHEPMGAFEPLPKGDYLAMATKNGWKDTKAGTGQYLEFTFQVLDGEHKGKTVPARLNLKNPNDTAVRIAKQELSSICRAAGVMRPQKSEELLEKPMVISVDLEERNDKPGSFNNRITGYEPTTGGAVGAVPSAPAAAAPADNTPPWRK